MLEIQRTATKFEFWKEHRELCKEWKKLVEMPKSLFEHKNENVLENINNKDLREFE